MNKSSNNYKLSDYYIEHLQIVARRNAELLKKNPEEFRHNMEYCGWEQADIEKMIKYINRISAE